MYPNEKGRLRYLIIATYLIVRRELEIKQVFYVHDSSDYSAIEKLYGPSNYDTILFRLKYNAVRIILL